MPAKRKGVKPGANAATTIAINDKDGGSDSGSGSGSGSGARKKRGKASVATSASASASSSAAADTGATETASKRQRRGKAAAASAFKSATTALVQNVLQLNEVSITLQQYGDAVNLSCGQHSWSCARCNDPTAAERGHYVWYKGEAAWTINSVFQLLPYPTSLPVFAMNDKLYYFPMALFIALNQNKESTIATLTTAATSALTAAVAISDESDKSEPDDKADVKEDAKSGREVSATYKPHVLVLTDEWFSAKGGISTFNRWMCRGLAQSGAKVTCAIPKICSQAETNDAKAHGVELIQPPIVISSEPNAETLAQLAFDSRVKYDVILGHAHITGPVAIAVADKRNTHSVVVLHTIPSANDPYMVGAVASDAVTKREQRTKEKEKLIVDAAKAASLVVSVGPKIFEHYNQHAKILKKNIQLLPYLPDHNEWQVVEFNKFCKDVLCFARVDSDTLVSKGVDLLMSVMPAAAVANKDMSVKIRGSKPGQSAEDRKKVEAMLRNKYAVQISVSVLPYASAAEIAEDLERSAVMVMPSRDEPFGLTGLEAMMRGIPTVISSKSGLAQCLTEQFDKKLVDSSIAETSTHMDVAAQPVHSWAAAIIGKWQVESAWKEAANLRQKLFNSPVWKNSSIAFVEAIRKLITFKP